MLYARSWIIEYLHYPTPPSIPVHFLEGSYCLCCSCYEQQTAKANEEEEEATVRDVQGQVNGLIVVVLGQVFWASSLVLVVQRPHDNCTGELLTPAAPQKM